jgi:branched-chain amino acid aminotransferase
MNRKFICYNGELWDAGQFALSVNNRAFRYGDSIFETMRSRGVTIPFFEYHFERLTRAMQLFRMKPTAFDKEHLLAAIAKTVRACKFYNGNSIRVTIFRQEGGKYAPTTNETDYIIEVDPVEDNRFTLNEKGLYIDVFENHFKSSSVLGNYKTGSALLQCLAGENMRSRNLGDVIIINERNKVVEALSSNLFAWDGKVLLTPALSTGCVDGVMRRIIIEIAQEMNISIEESSEIDPEQLLMDEELFVTNAVKGITWMVGFKNRRYLNRLCRKLTDEINIRAGW